MDLKLYFFPSSRVKCLIQLFRKEQDEKLGRLQHQNSIIIVE